MWSIEIGTLAFLVSVIPIVFYFLDRIDNWIASLFESHISSLNSTLQSSINFLAFILVTIFFMFILISPIVYLQASPIYNPQMSSPIHFSFNNYDLENDTINTSISISNPQDYDVVITSINYVNGELIKSNTSNIILKKKDAMILNMQLSKSKLKNSYYFIHLETTEGTIPIRISNI